MTNRWPTTPSSSAGASLAAAAAASRAAAEARIMARLTPAEREERQMQRTMLALEHAPSLDCELADLEDALRSAGLLNAHSVRPLSASPTPHSAPHPAPPDSPRGRPASAAAPRKKLGREVSVTTYRRLVIAGEVAEGRVFAYDEAVSVIHRLAAARVSHSSEVHYQELPPLTRNLTAFCVTGVHALAISPISLLAIVHTEALVPLLASLGPARSKQDLDHHLRSQRDWTSYKQHLVSSARAELWRAQERVQTQRRIGQRPPRGGARTHASLTALPELQQRAHEERVRNVNLPLEEAVLNAPPVASQLAMATGGVGSSLVEESDVANFVEKKQKPPSEGAHDASRRGPPVEPRPPAAGSRAPGPRAPRTPRYTPRTPRSPRTPRTPRGSGATAAAGVAGRAARERDRGRGWPDCSRAVTAAVTIGGARHLIDLELGT